MFCGWEGKRHYWSIARKNSLFKLVKIKLSANNLIVAFHKGDPAGRGLLWPKILENSLLATELLPLFLGISCAIAERPRRGPPLTNPSSWLRVFSRRENVRGGISFLRPALLQPSPTRRLFFYLLIYYRSLRAVLCMCIHYNHC